MNIKIRNKSDNKVKNKRLIGISLIFLTLVVFSIVTIDNTTSNVPPDKDPGNGGTPHALSIIEPILITGESILDFQELSLEMSSSVFLLFDITSDSVFSE